MIIWWTTYRLAFILAQIVASIYGQSTTASYLQGETYLDHVKYPRSKYYYFFTPRSQVRELLEPSATETLVEDRSYESYEGYEAKWPAVTPKVIHQQPIHVHHTMPYHKENNEKNYLLPILLLALLAPLLIGALLLLPLLFTFLTNVLQLLALMQQTLQNLQNNTGTGRRRRSDRYVNPVILTTLSSLVDKFIDSQQKYAKLE